MGGATVVVCVWVKCKSKQNHNFPFFQSFLVVTLKECTCLCVHACAYTCGCDVACVFVCIYDWRGMCEWVCVCVCVCTCVHLVSSHQASSTLYIDIQVYRQVF